MRSFFAAVFRRSRLDVAATVDRAARGEPTALMVLYYFPPIGGISTARNLKNVQYLPSYGWRPIVLTPRDSGVGLRDLAGLDAVPRKTPIVRTRSIEAGHLRPIAIRVRDALTRIRRSGVGSGSSGGAGATPAAGSRLTRLRRLVFFPDDQVGWLPFALRTGLRLARRGDVDVVFSTSSPVTAHLIAGVVSRLARIPWVAEFRDPWVGNALEAPLPWPHRRLKRKLERWVVTSADRVVCVTPGLTRLFERRYRGHHHFVTIPNGYDRSERVARRTARDDSRYRIVYAGSLYRPGELETFLAGVKLFTERSPSGFRRLEIVFYGDVTPDCRGVFDRYSDRLQEIVRIGGFVPRRVALQEVADADAALVLLGAGPGMGLFVGGKLYDYLGQDTQVLAMVPPGDARDLLESLSWGVLADPEPGAVACAIERLLATPPPTRHADPDGLYDRENLARRLAGVLADATAEYRMRGIERPGDGLPG